jgi:hypothetical protein
VKKNMRVFRNCRGEGGISVQIEPSGALSVVGATLLTQHNSKEDRFDECKNNERKESIEERRNKTFCSPESFLNWCQ